MSYYSQPMGDYKTYGYAGDPGFLSSLWRGIKKVAPMIIGGAIGGPIGGMLGGIPGGGAQTPMRRVGTPPIIGGAVSFPGGMRVSGAYQYKDPRPPGQYRLPPYTATGPGVLPYGGAGVAHPPSGYHYAKDGSGRIVRNRRMNIANPRALRRAMRRVQGFEKLARRTITFTRRTRMKKRKS